jgi:hypothetical protein
VLVGGLLPACIRGVYHPDVGGVVNSNFLSVG